MIILAHTGNLSARITKDDDALYRKVRGVVQDNAAHYLKFGEAPDVAWGEDDKRLVLDVASQWNTVIRRELCKCLCDLIDDSSEFVSEKSRRLHIAAEAADGVFSPYTRMAILALDNDNKKYHIDTVMVPDTLKSIKKNPEDWALLEFSLEINE